MNKPRDPKGRYIKTKPKLSIKVPSNLFGGRNTPPINSIERYWKIGVSSTQRAKEVSKETKTGDTIEQKIETSTVVGHQARPLEPSSEPTNTTFAFLPPSGDSNYVYIIEKTLSPIVSTDLSKVTDIQTLDKYSH
jgi:hypothetical protein